MSPKKLKFVVALAVVVGGVVFLMAGKLRGAFRYSETVTAVVQGGEMLAGRSLRIQAKYVDDSLVKMREGGKPFFEFGMAEGASKLTVRYDDEAGTSRVAHEAGPTAIDSVDVASPDAYAIAMGGAD